tara:strand:+ start:311 stop:634 length:324 start_codon:yes stop_codon:yes gene_type:complete
MIGLNDDIIRYIALQLNLKDILNLNSTCKIFNLCLDHNFFKYIAIQIYSKEFWEKAELRPIITSNPLNCMKKEIIRIERFQKQLIKHEKKPWSKIDFYNYWNTVDNN